MTHICYSGSIKERLLDLCHAWQAYEIKAKKYSLKKIILSFLIHQHCTHQISMLIGLMSCLTHADIFCSGISDIYNASFSRDSS